MKTTIQDNMHPDYLIRAADWQKFRFIMRGGDTFVREYVQKFSDAESDTDFERRLEFTPVAAFAKAAIKDVQNSIYQRMDGIVRAGGTSAWIGSIAGKMGGVDLQGSNMNHFIGTEVLPELLAMGKVGVYIDNHQFDPRSLKQRGSEHPYFYIYVAEDIRNWEYYIKGDSRKLKRVLLRIRSEITEPQFELISNWVEGYRYYWIDDNDGLVYCQEYDDKGVSITEPIQLAVKEIPLHIIELDGSLLEDIANHQIALTNMESADIGYALRSNVPFYIEQRDHAFDHSFNQGPFQEGDNDRNRTELKVGATDGRTYGKGLDAPGFINPSPEPLQISMEKQKALKDDIRQLINLALSNVKSKFASAESKVLDEAGLEAGLSAIGLELEHAERIIAEAWRQYENVDTEITINYPKRYSLKTDADRREEVDQLNKLTHSVASKTFRITVQKQIAMTWLTGKIPDSVLEKILKEIESTEYPTADPDLIRNDVEIGLVSRVSASLARGYKDGEAEKAKEEKKEADVLRMQSQTKGFNLGSNGLDPLAAKDEKQQSQNPENNPDGKKQVRGVAK